MSFATQDTKAPDVTIANSPAKPTTEDKVTFTATASDPGGIGKVEIYVNGKMVEGCSDSPCTYVGGPYPLGSVTYAAHASDKSNNKATAGPGSFTIKDAEAPVVTIAINPSAPTTKEKVTFTATASDLGGIGKVQIYVKNVKVQECTGSPCTYVGGPYPLGSVTYAAHASDKSDNKAVAGPNSFTTRDAEAPIVAITHTPPRPTIEEKVTFTATASDPTGIQKVEVYVNNSKVKECTGSPCTYVGGPYPLGSFSYAAHALDKSNNKAVAGPMSFATQDTKGPNVTIANSPAKPTTEDKVTFTATATDPGGIGKVEVYVNGKNVEVCTGSPCTYAGGPYPLGNVSYHAYAYDKSGNKTSTGAKTLAIIDATPPDVSITPNPLAANLNQKVTFTATASDPGGINKVQIFVKGSMVKECTGSPCTYAGGPYPLGNVTYEAYAWDKSGNRKQTGSKSLSVMNFNFEKGNLLGWTKTGTAFNFQPTLGDNPTARKRGQPSRHEGNYWIGTYERRPFNIFPAGSILGDQPTGSLTSNPFIIPSARASFLVGGGAGNGVAVQLLVDGKLVLSAKGKNNETMERVYWDLSKYVNKSAMIKIKDDETGPWGHINFDDFRFESLFIMQPITPILVPGTIPLKVLPK